MNRRALRAVLVVATAAIALLVIGAGSAAAHASLLAIDPPDGARLDQSPEVVTLTFSEPVSVDLGGVRVLDRDGNRMEQGAARVDGTTVSIDVTPDLPDGTYVISYRVVSADGHPVRGGTVFGVGDVDVDASAIADVAGDDDRVWEIVGGVGRGFAYAGILIAAGGAILHLFADRDAPAEVRRSRRRLIHVAAVVGGVSALVALPIQAALGTGQGPMALFDHGVLADVAADGVGHSLLLALVGLLLLSIGLDRSTPAVAVGSLVAAGSFAATGHTRAGDTATLATLADIVHLLAAAVWAGGLIALWLTLRAHRRHGVEPVRSGELVARFSRLATIGILGVGAAGLALSWSEVRYLSALTGTTYGLLLLAKVAMVVAMAAMGAYNHFRLVPAMSAGKTKAALARLRLTLRIELVALVAVAALTSVIVVLTPAKASEGPGVFEQIVELDGAGSVQVVIAPAQAGFNQVHLYTYDPDGRTADIAESVTLELTHAGAGIGPIDREAVRAGPAHLQLDTDDLAVAGEWEITIRARVDRFDEATATLSVDIAR